MSEADDQKFEDFWNVVDVFNTDARICITLLDGLPENDPRKFVWRRLLARSTFALIDSITFRLMLHGYKGCPSSEVKHSPEDLEKFYDFDEDGKACPTVKRSTMAEALEFCFRAYAQGFNSDYVLPTTGPEWDVIGDLDDLRLRLEYPFSCADLELTEEEDVQTILQSIRWLTACWGKLLDKSVWNAVANFQGGHRNDPSTS